MKSLDTPLDTSEEAQAPRRAAMLARLQQAEVETVSELSPLHERAIIYDGVAGAVIYIHDTEDRFAADLIDGRRVWGTTSELVDADGLLTFTNVEG